MSRQPAQKPVLLLSNGHGEDLSGARIAQVLITHGLAVEALPLVGHGRPYRQAGVPVLGRTRECSTGGLGYTSLQSQLQEIREGQWTYLLARLLWLLRQRRRYALVVAVGDVLPVLGAWWSRIPAVVYLVAYSSHYEGRLRLPWPCAALLRCRRLARIWSRDPLTAADLSRQLGRTVAFVGNPFMDGLPRQGFEALGTDGRRATDRQIPACQSLALVPGSRLPEAAHNLGLMLQVLAQLPLGLQQSSRLRLRAALISGLTAEAIGQLADPLGWQLDRHQGRLRRGGLELELGWGQFEAILASADLVLASAGTAAEQAVGLGKPVLQVCGSGPQFTPAFAEAQRRLLGPGVSCAPGQPLSPATWRATAELAAAHLIRLADPEQGPIWRQQLAALGAERLGAAGGSEPMAAAIMELLRPRG